MKEDVPWSKVRTLEETVVEMIRAKRTKTEEFQSILRFFGRARVEAIWQAYRDRQKAEKNACASDKPVTASESQ